MKALRIPAAIFLGRNTANLAMRFEVHIWSLIGLLILAGAGGGMRSVAELYVEHGRHVSDGLMSVIEIGNISMYTAFILGGYLLFAMTALTLLGVFLKGTDTEEPTAEA